MKTLSTLLIALAIVASSASAQDPVTKPDNRWGFGVFAGVNYSFPRIVKLYPIHYTGSAGWLAGVDLNYQINNRQSLHIQPSLMRMSDIGVNKMMSLDPAFNMTLLQIPILYRYYVLPKHKSLFVEVGGAFNQIVASNYRENLGIVCCCAPCPVAGMSGDELTPVTKSAVSLMGGIGIDIAVQKVTIPVTLRYEYYVSSYAFPGNYDQSPRTPVSFENVSITTGVNF